MVKFREIVNADADPPKEARELTISNEHADKLEALEKRMGVRHWERIEQPATEVATTTPTASTNAKPQQSESNKGK